MAGPIDTRVNPNRVNTAAATKPLSWFERRVVDTVPRGYAGAGRRVYPGVVQLTAFMSMNPKRHLSAHGQLYRDLVAGNTERAAATRAFYDEYGAVMDVPAEFYLETVGRIFQEHHLPTGQLTWRGQRVDPGAISRTALLTVEGENDDICSPGQTLAAHELCTGIPQERKHHHLQPGVGHYGVFSGSRWEAEVYPVVRGFIDARPRAAGRLRLSDLTAHRGRQTPRCASACSSSALCPFASSASTRRLPRLQRREPGQLERVLLRRAVALDRHDVGQRHRVLPRIVERRHPGGREVLGDRERLRRGRDPRQRERAEVLLHVPQQGRPDPLVVQHPARDQRPLDLPVLTGPQQQTDGDHGAVVVHPHRHHVDVHDGQPLARGVHLLAGEHAATGRRRQLGHAHCLTDASATAPERWVGASPVGTRQEPAADMDDPELDLMDSVVVTTLSVWLS